MLMERNKDYVIGVDYGTDSCRAILADAADGGIVAEASCPYPRWAEGRWCDPSSDRYRQHPLDYIESFRKVISVIVAKAGNDVISKVRGLSFDTTASTPVLVDSNGTPLAMLPEFREDPDAMFILWKDHTAKSEAEEINALARKSAIDYTSYSGGAYSAEWAWSKVLHVLRTNDKVAGAAYSWMEHCDWMPAWLTGTVKPETAARSRCAAGHKAMWRNEWGGLPDEEFLGALDPRLIPMRRHLYRDTCTADTCIGAIRPDLAVELGLPGSVKVGSGSIDAHVGAVGACVSPGTLVKIIGTSTCDILVAEPETVKDRRIAGICGQVDGSVIPGLVGFEAGQSAFGDIYAWFGKVLMWPVENMIPEAAASVRETLLSRLEKEALKISDEDSAVTALDWMNGRRTPDADQRVKGAIAGITLGTTAPMIYKALIEAAAFGSKAIIDRFASEGVEIGSIVAVGGISRKSTLVMQTMADVLGMPIEVPDCDQACALGAAMLASAASGIYPDTASAQRAMRSPAGKTYLPDMERHRRLTYIYDNRYRPLGEFAQSDAR